MSKEDHTTNDIMRWVGSPSDPKLEHATKLLVDEHFDDPSLTFRVAALAMARQELCAYPALIKLEEDLYRELFSEKRRAEATNGELVAMGKLLHERKAAAIALAEGNTASAEKPRLQARLQLNGEGNPGVERFSPTQRQRMRRIIEAEAADGPIAHARSISSGLARMPCPRGCAPPFAAVADLMGERSHNDDPAARHKPKKR